MLIQLQRKINYFFRNAELLKCALTHKSFAHESSGTDNEKLEFFGDSIIGMLVNEYLYKRFQDYSEGKLSTVKATVVSKPTLARRAVELEMGKYILLGKGEETSNGRTKPSILANAFEALVAAIYLDSNLEECRNFVVNQLKGEIEEANNKGYGRDCKGMLQEYVQSEYGVIPSYRVVSAEGPEHKKCFKVIVTLKGAIQGKGKGASKKEAEKSAALDAWEHVCKQELRIK